MKTILRNDIVIILILILPFGSCSQTTKPINLPTEKSNQHTDIPLYAFSIILPDPDYINQEGSSNFINQKYKSSITISTLGIGIDSSISNLKETNGGQIKIDVRKEVQNSVMRGMIIKLKPVFEFNPQYSDSTIVWFLLLGDQTNTYAITAKYPKQYEKVLSDKVLRSLSSLCFDNKKKVDPFETAAFTLDMSKTNLHYVGLNYGQAYFNLKGKSFSESLDDAVLIMSKMEMPVPENEREDFINTLLKPKYNDIISKKEILLDSIPGVEVIAKEKERGTLSFLVVLFNRNELYTFSGYYKTVDEPTIELFRNFINTFKLK